MVIIFLYNNILNYLQTPFNKQYFNLFPIIGHFDMLVLIAVRMLKPSSHVINLPVF